MRRKKHEAAYPQSLNDRPVSDDDAAHAMGNGHPKCNTPSLHDSASVLPGSPGSGSAPGANGPPTTGAVGPGGPLGAT